MNNESPLISIVMPAYKAADTISEAIESVLAQSHGDFELIICDDASPDSTAQSVAQYKDQRIVLLANTDNLGAGPTRNRAIAMARGQWLTFLDADDAWLLQRLERMLAVAKMHPNAIVFDELMECHDTTNGLQPWRRMRTIDAFPGARNEVRKIEVGDWIGTRRLLSFPIIPMQLIRKHSPTHPNISSGEDISFRLSLLARSRAELWYVPDPLYLYRLRPGSLSSRPDSTRLLISVLENAIPEFEWSPKTQEAIRKRITQAQRREAYLEFFVALINGKIHSAAKAIIARPWVVWEFLHRTIAVLPYHFSRLLSGGSWKRKF